MMETTLRNVPMISFVAARSGTGKTTYLEKVIAVLSGRGYRVVALKDAKQANFDLPGKDSWRHRRAGALAVGLVGGQETLIVSGAGGHDPREVLPFLPEADFVLFEGFRRFAFPKIEVVRGALGKEIVSPPHDLIAVVTDVPELAAPVPCFPLHEAEPLVDWLIARYPAGESARPREFTHVDGRGRARMVDVSAKEETLREAVARGEVQVGPETIALIAGARISKGDVLSVAQVAAIMAVKETSRLIPLCHPLGLSGVSVDLALNEAESKVEIEVRVRATDRGRDGGPDRSERGCSHRLRHVQGRGSGDADRPDPPGGKTRRAERALPPGG